MCNSYESEVWCMLNLNTTKKENITSNNEGFYDNRHKQHTNLSKVEVETIVIDEVTLDGAQVYENVLKLTQKKEA